MSIAVAPGRERVAVVVGELAKLPAFMRRDFLVAWSYRASFMSDALAMGMQAIVFYFVGRMVDPSVLPSYGGTRASYMEFVTVGIALGVFIQLGLGRVAAGVRSEQLMGTLESILMTPTSPTTIQLGSVVYDLIYIPIRTTVFIVIVAAAFGLDFDFEAIVPAAVILVAFIPFVWGCGVAAAAGILTFKRGSGGVGFAVTLLTLASGAYFPLDLFPGWVASIAALNPLAVAIEGMREVLLGGAGWEEVGSDVVILVPFSLAALAAGLLAFRLAMRREKRIGSLALY